MGFPGFGASWPWFCFLSRLFLSGRASLSDFLSFSYAKEGTSKKKKKRGSQHRKDRMEGGKERLLSIYRRSVTQDGREIPQQQTNPPPPVSGPSKTFPPLLVTIRRF